MSIDDGGTMDTIEHLKEHILVVILRRLPYEHTLKIADALYKGGIRTIEITVDSEKSLELIGQLKEKYPTMKIGTGTVLSLEQAEQVIKSGADFILSPVINKEVIQYVVNQQCVMIPGAYTPTEIFEGFSAGAQIIKLFPAATLGPKYISDVSAPLTNIPIAPTGGINEQNLMDYLKANAFCVGISSAIPTKFQVLDDAAIQQIVEKATLLTTIVKEFKKR